MLCSLAKYRDITKDFESFDGDVTRALDDAQLYIEEQTGRLFDRATRIESMKLYPDGRVYPRATPIHEAPDGATVEGNSIVGVAWSAPTVFALWTARHRVVVEYEGGYDEGEVPQELVRATAVLAKSLAPANQLSSVPVGATSVRVGDVAISGEYLGGSSEIPESVRSTVRRWRKRDI